MLKLEHKRRASRSYSLVLGHIQISYHSLWKENAKIWPLPGKVEAELGETGTILKCGDIFFAQSAWLKIFLFYLLKTSRKKLWDESIWQWSRLHTKLSTQTQNSLSGWDSKMLDYWQGKSESLVQVLCLT